MYLASSRRFRHVDLLLCPQALDGFSTLDPRRHAEILDVGYRAAVERIDEIAALVASAG
jgi:hypothetical protein